MNRQHLLLLLVGFALFAGIFTFQRESTAADLRLSWSDNSDDEEGFEIQRYTSSTAFVTVAIVGANVNHFSDLRLAPGTTYCYRVRAFNADDLSDFSNLGCATTPTMVSVSKFGSGTGTVLSNPSGIDCGNDCVEPYTRGTIVSLMANPAEGSVFAGWNGGGCAGTGICMFNVETDLSITAVFASTNPETTPQPGDPPPPPITPSPPPLILTGLNADLISPQYTDAPVTFTAAASGGVVPLQFKWWVFDGSDWGVKQEWSTNNTFIFAPGAPGSYIIGLWARSSGYNDDSPENDAVLIQTFTIMPLSCPTGQYLAEYYKNRRLSGSRSFTACDSSINYAWAGGSPGNGIGSDNFSVRWTGRFLFSAGSYAFTGTADDGIRAWVDGNQIINGWVDQGATTYQATVDLSEGEHVVQVEYYENRGDALARFNWQKLVISADDHYVMFENERLVVDAPGVLGNELIGDALTVALVSPTSNGVLELNPDGSFTYTPKPYFSGLDSFTYRANNGITDSNLATVTITVTHINAAPLASNDSYVVSEDNTLMVEAPGVLGNDNDFDANVLTARLVSTTSNGVLILNPDGSFIYTPNPDFSGTDSFAYVANDGISDSNVAMVTITVTEFNDVPVAQNDGYETEAGSALTVAAPGVLINDTDADGNPLTAALVTAPLFGALTLNPNGSFDYIPAVNFSGMDSFSYKANDGVTDSNVAMVTISVNTGTLVGGVAPAITVSVSKFGSGMGTVVSNPSGIDCGNDCIERYPRGTIVTLTPNPAEGSVFVGWNGGVCAGTGVCMFNLDTDLSVTAVFDILPEFTNPPNAPQPPPSAAPPPLMLTGLNANLVSPQIVGTSVTLTAVAAGGNSPPEFKWWVSNGVDWRVEKDWGTSDTFVWTPTSPGDFIVGLWARSKGNSSDGPENSAVLTQTFTITPSACNAGQYLAEFYSNMSLSGSPAFTACNSMINYVWGEGGPGNGVGSDDFSARWTGRFTFSTGRYRFTAMANDGIRAWIDGNPIINGWLDQEATTYQTSVDLSEGEHFVQVEYYENGGGALAQFNWQRLVTGSHDYYVMYENERLTVEAPGVLGNDNEIAGNPLTATLVSPTTNGAMELNPDGSFSYTPNANFSGVDSFLYSADNGSTYSDLTMVTISVTQVNDVPVASNDSIVVFTNDSWAVGIPGVLGNDNDLDGDLLTAVLVGTTSNGTLTLNPDGSFIYTPNPNFVGIDTFTYVANDGQSDSNVAMVTITVTQLNDIPVAQNDGYQTNEASLLTVVAPGVLGNDVNANGNPLTATLVTAPLFGALTLNADGSFDYLPAVNFTGTDSFSYRANDGSADSNMAMVTITVNHAGSGI